MATGRDPKLSFIVLSYNYADYIGQTIRSILDQSIQDFEVIVVDDASSDDSCRVIESFNDPRINLLVNPQNLGGAASYNRAVQAARGEYLVNLDADDWIVPTKSEQQLTFLQQKKVEVLGTYVAFVGADGKAHPQASVLSETVNKPHQLNGIEAWVGQNNLVRSSTLVERAAHLRVGLDDVEMVRACDYELWTRFLRSGARFAVVPEVLTFYRLHSRGVTHVDPRDTLLEMAYAMLKNLVPIMETRAAYPSFLQMLDWIVPQEAFARLSPTERYRLLGAALGLQEFPGFHAFRGWLSDTSNDPAATAAGRRLLATVMLRDVSSNVHKLHADLAAVTEARDFWHQQSVAAAEARDFWHQQSVAWEQSAMALQYLYAFYRWSPSALRRLLKSGLLRMHRQKQKTRVT